MSGVRGVAVVLGALLATALACSSHKSHSSSAGPPSDDGGGGGDDAGLADGGDDSGDAADEPEAAPQCMYPAGPYGRTMGTIVPPTLSWKGYLPGATAITTIKASDLYDCDGTKGINAILFDEAALWCGPCNQEAGDQSYLVQPGGKWLKEGVAWVTLVIQDTNQNPATTANATSWRNEYKLQQAYVFADPGFDFAHSGQNGLPTNILVDPRTMKIVNIVEGYGGPDDPTIDQLAVKNAMH